MGTVLRRWGPWAAAVTVVLAAGTAWASGDTMEPGEIIRKIIVHAINFTLYVGILVYFLRRPLKDFLANRRLGIKKELEESHRLKTDAQARHGEIQHRIGGFDQEVEEVLADVRHHCEVEADRAVLRAEEAAETIQRVAQRTISEETEKARHDLRAETVDLAVQMAREALINAVSAEDQRRLADGYMARIAEDAEA
jgi:F-type H+-transporting ATPase subunit b